MITFYVAKWLLAARRFWLRVRPSPYVVAFDPARLNADLDDLLLARKSDWHVLTHEECEAIRKGF